MSQAASLIFENLISSNEGKYSSTKKLEPEYSQNFNAGIHRNRPDLKFWVEKFNACANKLMLLLTYENGYNQDDIDFIKKCIERIETLSLIAPAHDYKNVESNGYRSFIKLRAKMFEAILHDDSHRRRMECIKVLQRTESLYESFEDYHNQNQSSADYDYVQQRALAQKFDQVCKDGTVWETLHKQPLVLIQLEDRLRVTFRYFSHFIPFMMPETSYGDAFRSLFSEDYLAKVLSRTFSKMTIGSITHFMSWGDTIASTMAPVWAIYRIFTGFDANTHVTSVETKLKSNFILDVTTGELIIRKADQNCNRTSNIRYQMVRTDQNCKRTSNIRYQMARTNEVNQKSEYDQKILLYIHGGAFVGPKGPSLENICVRKWARSMPGLTVINFDYTLCPMAMFPTQVQELLDFYTWLTGESSREEVIQRFGFLPKDVVFAGDSAGGQISTSLLTLINELNRKFDAMIKVPKGLVLIFPKVSMNFQQVPSLFSCLVDPMIVPQLLPTVYQAYVPMKRFDTLKQEYKLVPKEEQVTMPCGAIFQDGNEMIQSIILDPINYKYFEEMRETSLNIITFEYDPFLDEAILLAKRWKGRVDLRVMDDLCHSSTILGELNHECKKAELELIDLIKSSLLN